MMFQVLFDMEGVSFVIIGKLLIFRVFGNIIFIRKEWSCPTDLQDTFAAVHDSQFILCHKLVAGFLHVIGVAAGGPTGIAGICHVDRLFSQDLRHFFESACFFATKEKCGIAVAHDDVGSVFIDRFQLRQALQYDRSGDFPAPYGGNQFLKPGDLSDIAKFVQKTADMDRKTAIILIIRQITEQIEKLGVENGDNEIESVVCVRDNDEEGSLFSAETFQIHFIIGSEIPQFFDIKWSKPGSARNKYALRCLSSSKLIFFILPHCKVFRFLLLQFLKKQINGIFEVFIVFTGF